MTITDAPNSLFDDNYDSNHEEFQEMNNELTTDNNHWYTDKLFPEAEAIILHSS